MTGFLAGDPEYRPYEDARWPHDIAPPKAECGACTLLLPSRPGGEERLARDSECAQHGVDADPSWWRTPRDYREDGPGAALDELPDDPEITAREAAGDAAMERHADRRRDGRYGS